MDTHSHLYPNKQTEVAIQLDALSRLAIKTVRCSQLVAN